MKAVEPEFELLKRLQCSCVYVGKSRGIHIHIQAIVVFCEDMRNNLTNHQGVIEAHKRDLSQTLAKSPTTCTYYLI